MTKKNNRSYLLQSVISKNGSWNSDFSGSPKQVDGTFFASDRALKYAARNLMEQMGKKTFIKKWVIAIGDSSKKGSSNSELKVMNSNELKEELKKQGIVFKDSFWEFEDIRHFGLLYDNLSLHGVVQISQGIDLYGGGITYVDDLTGRMVFESSSGKGDTRGMSSRNFLTEGHFIYDISVNPKNVAFLSEIKGYEKCYYTEDDYQTLLISLIDGPRNVKSTQKTNCYTGFMLQIDLKDDSLVTLGDLQSKLIIELEKVDNKVVYDLSNIISYLEKFEDKHGKDLFKKISIKYENSEILLKGIEDTKLNFELESSVWI